MSVMYCYSKTTPYNDIQLIHKIDCHTAPNEHHREYLGWFGSCFCAVIEGLKIHRKVMGCKFCCMESHQVPSFKVESNDGKTYYAEKCVSHDGKAYYNRIFILS